LNKATFINIEPKITCIYFDYTFINDSYNISSL